MSIEPGQRVRHWRELRGIAQDDLARKAKMSKHKLCRIELGNQPPRAKEIERLAEALGLTMPEFYGAEDRPS